jgi:dipeptidyl aminopeptidase/acylaminoacyl peptidase
MNRLLDIDYLVRAPEVEAAFDVSPDGERIAFIWNHTGRYEVYLLHLITRELVQLTRDGASNTCPRFSPDGSKLLYARDHDGDERWDFYLLDFETQHTRCILQQKASGYASASWSPDGRWLLMTSAVDGRFTLCRCEIDTGALTPLTSHAFNDDRGEISLDGEWIAFDAHTTGQDRGLFVTRADGSQLHRLPLQDAANPKWSPGGQHIAFSAMRESDDVGVFDLETGSVRWLAASRWDEWGATWSPDGKFLAYIENEDGSHSIHVVHVETGERITTIAPEDGVIESAMFARGGNSIVFTFSNHRTPNSLWEYRFDTRRCEQLTPALAGVDRDGFIAPYFVRYAGDDGVTVPAIVYVSRTAGRDTSAILLIHGGPTWAYTNFWNPAAQHFAQMGYTVIGPNYRGSTGYGRVYQNLNRYDVGRGDMLDCIAGVEWLLREGMASRAKLGVTGASQGGYMTMMCLAKHPDYWTAGSSVVGFFNYLTEFETEREDLRYWDLQNMGDPSKPEDAERYRDRSPIFFIDAIQAPVQLIAGRRDPRCPASETEQVHKALISRGIPVEMTIYEDEGHGFGKIENRIDAYRRRAEFFSRHLD